MRTEPTDLSAGAVAGALASHWGIAGVTLTYLPLGFGSHHWLADAPGGQRWFVTVDDHRGGRIGVPERESIAALGRAMGTAAALRDAGLAFVLAPVPGQDGRLVVPVAGTLYTVAVFPFLAAEALSDWGRYPTEAGRRAALGLVARVHRATDLVPPGLPATDSLAIPRRDDLLVALGELGETWAAGPYGEATRAALSGQGVRIVAALRTYDALVAPLLADQSRWVITHGEPHAGNVLRGEDGALLLVDWDTALVGPPERDLWMLTADGGVETDWSDYTGVMGNTVVSDDAIRAFRLRWDLSEVAEYVAWFRRPHGSTDDTATAWGGFLESLSKLPAGT